MRDIVVLGGSSHPNLTSAICRILTIAEGEVKLSKFSNGETSVEIQDSVREKDVFIIQSGCGDVNDMFIQLCVMISACKTASAKRVTAVLPLFPYSRQPDVPHLASLTGAPLLSTKKEPYTFERSSMTSKSSNSLESHTSHTETVPSTSLENPTLLLKKPPSNLIIPPESTGKSETGYKQWIAQNGTLIANLLTTAGADRLITMDLHDPQFQGFFNIPVDNLYSKPLLKYYITDHIPNYKECVIVSPDSGGAKRAAGIADSLGCSFALINKERRNKTSILSSTSTSTSLNLPSHSSNSNLHGSTLVANTMLVGDVKDRICVLVDDLVDTSYTITRAAKLLKDQGAKYIYALVTHGIFSGDALNRIDKSPIDKVITTNSVPQGNHINKLGSKMEVLDVSRIFAEAVRRIHNGESVSMLFDHGW